MSKVDSICLAMRAGSAAGWSIYREEGSNRAIETGLGTAVRFEDPRGRACRSFQRSLCF